MSETKPHILVLAPFPPWPLRSGGAASIFPRLVALSASYQVHLACTAPANLAEEGAIRQELEKFCASVTWWPMFAKNVRWHTREGLLRQAAGLLGPPLRNAMSQAAAASRVAESIAALHPIEIIQCEGSALCEPVWRSDVLARLPLVVVEHNIEHEFALECAEAKGGWLNVFLNRLAARQVERFCAAAYRRIDEVRFLSERDAEFWRRRLPGEARLTSGAGILGDPGVWKTDSASTGRLALLGSAAASQVRHGAEWLAAEVLPGVLASAPGLRLLLSRSLAPCFAGKSLRGLQLDFLDETSVAAMDRQIIACDAVVSAIFKGSGIKMKNLIAFALGLPVIATRKSLEGIPATHGTEVWVADEPAAFQTALLRMLQDEPARARAMRAVRALYERQYSTDGAARGWQELIESHRRSTPNPSPGGSAAPGGAT